MESIERLEILGLFCYYYRLSEALRTCSSEITQGMYQYER